jgi:hypothetical protein
MTIVYWAAIVLLSLTLLVSGLCFVVNLITDDRDWYRRARAWFRWALVVVLSTFNIAVFRHLIGALLGE